MEIGRYAGARGRTLSIAGMVVFCALAVRAVVSPIVYYDSWGYHLPFSSLLLGIGGGAETFHPSAMAMERFRGFPLLWEWVQGVAWWVTGSLFAITVPQILLMLAYLFVCRRVLGVPMGWVVLGLVGCPMILVHAQGTNNDLPGALANAVAFLLIADLAAREPGPSDRWRMAGFVAALTVAGNIKYQALIGGLVIAGLGGLAMLFAPRMPSAGGWAFVAGRRWGLIAGRRWAFVAGRRWGVIACLALGIAGASLSCVSNVIHFGNPFWPIGVTAGGGTVFAGPESEDHDAGYPAYLLRGSHQVTLPEPVNFVLSLTELDWTMRGVVPWYNADAVNGRTALRGPPSRTGGWGMIFVAAQLGFLSLQLWGWRRLGDARQRRLALMTAALTVLTAFVPRSHELRYWMYLPLIWVPVNLRYLRQEDAALRFAPAIVSGIAAIGVTLTILSPKSGLLTRDLPPEAERRAEVPPEILDALKAHGIYCEAADKLFQFSGAVTGLPGILSQNPDDCAAH